MKKLCMCLVVLCVLMSTSGCGKVERLTASVAGKSEMCVDGVTYIQFTSGACPKYTIDGKLVPCK